MNMLALVFAGIAIVLGVILGIQMVIDAFIYVFKGDHMYEDYKDAIFHDDEEDG